MSNLPPLVLAVSRPGRALAVRIADGLGAELSSAQGSDSDGGDTRAAFAEALRAKRPVIAVGALGIWVRRLAPHLGDKLEDPPLVVVDDAGQFAIVVVGGHRGGNALAEDVTRLLDGTAVITTASEVLGLPSVEVLAARYGWRLEASREARLHVSAALVDGEPVAVYQDQGERDWLADLPAHAHRHITPPTYTSDQAALFVTDRALPEIAGWGEHAAVLRPHTLVAGIGASRGVTSDEVLTLLRAAFAEAGLATGSVAMMASATLKSDEAGILEAAAVLEVPLRCFPTEDLAAVEVPTPSAVVAMHVQTASVCEAAALLASGASTLLLAKRKSAHATVAIARIAEGSQR